jgi:hypothetical protein
MAAKLPDIYVDFNEKLIVLEHEHGGVMHQRKLTREEAKAYIARLICGLEELAVYRHQL